MCPTALNHPEPQLAAPTELAAPDVPELSNRHVYLRPVVQADYGMLQLAETTGTLGPRWRFKGATPAPESYVPMIWNNVLSQQLVFDRATDAPLGIAAIYGATFQDGTAKLAAGKFDTKDPSPKFMLGIGLLLRYTFAVWNFRKLYMESPEYNYAQFASGTGSMWELEGRLREHSFFAGRYWDELILTLTRERWEEHGRPLLEKLDGRTASEVWVKLPTPGGAR